MQAVVGLWEEGNRQIGWSKGESVRDLLVAAESWTRSERTGHLTELRLLGGLEVVAKALEECTESIEDLTDSLKLVKVLSEDTECAEELGHLGVHRFLLKASKSFNWPWSEPDVSDAVAEAIATTLSKLSQLISISPVGVLDVRERPFSLDLQGKVAHTKVYLRQVREQVNESGIGDRANIRVGYRLWGGAVVLGLALNAMGERACFQGKKILEIGAGLGVCGLVCGQRLFGADKVVLTDFHPRIVDNLQFNIELNGLDLVENCVAEILDWERVVRQQEQGESQTEEETFDIIVGSDLVCEASDCALVAAVLHAKLSQDGIAWITLGSSESRYGVDEFEKTIRDAGFAIQQLDALVPDFCLPNQHEGDMRVDSGGEIPVFVGTAKSYLSFRISRHE